MSTPPRALPRFGVAPRLGLSALALVLAACSEPPPPTPEPRPIPVVAAPRPTPTPPVVAEFGTPRPLAPQRANAEMVRDFLDLSFNLESGRPLQTFTRFEGPLTYAVTGMDSPRLDAELNRLLGRLRREARLDLRQVDDPAQAAITIEAIPSGELHRVLPEAACFVLPTKITWQEFRYQQRSTAYDWAALTERKAISVFIPGDTSRQEIRDCLHEEIAQGLGPLNDLYRLEDSVFNDDNLHSVLTGFDMLMLRVTYDQRLHSGMTKAQVAARLPAILSFTNPGGNAIPARPYQPTPDSWKNDITTALGAGSQFGRRAAATRALAQAQNLGWADSRTALSHYMLGRLSMSDDRATALAHLKAAVEMYRSRPDTEIHAANVSFHIGVLALRTGQWETVLRLCARYEPVARRYENAALLADLQFQRAAALKGMGRDPATVLREARAWGIYAWGTPARVEARLTEIFNLATPAQL